MPNKYGNRIKVSTSTTGTGTITLGSAVDGFQTFSSGGITDGSTVAYVIEDGSNFEIGTGTYTASGTTLTRTVSESNNSNSAISLSGDAVVFVAPSASDLPFTDGASFSGAVTFAEDVTFDGATAGRDILFDRSDNALEFADNAKAKFGTGGDLEIYHSGSDSIIKDVGDGALNVYSNAVDFFNAAGSERTARFIGGGSNILFNAGAIKLQTNATGIDVTGVITDDGATHDGDVTFTGASYSAVWDKSDSALEFASGATATFGGSLTINATNLTYNQSGSQNFQILSNKEMDFKVSSQDRITLRATGAVDLYHSTNGKKFETTSSGVSVTGNIVVSGTVDGRDIATDGTKLDGIEASADVTDATTVAAAGALMDSEVTNLAQVKAFDSSDYATAAQGSTADAAMPKSGGNFTGSITTNDAVSISLGADTDLQLNHNNSNAGQLISYTGEMTVKSNASIMNVSGSSVKLQRLGATVLEAYSNTVDITGNLVISGTVDGRDVAADGTKLDGISTGANVGIPTTGGTFTGDVKLNDSVKLYLGSDSDVSIEYDPNTFRINAGSWNAQYQAGNHYFRNAGGSVNAMIIDPAGAITLKHNNSTKLETASGGVTITGTATATSFAGSGANLTNIPFPASGGTFTGDVTIDNNDELRFGTGTGQGYDFRMWWDDTNSKALIQSPTNESWPLEVRMNGGLKVSSYNGAQASLHAIIGGAVTLYHNSSPKLETTSTGLDINGNIVRPSGDFSITAAGALTLESTQDDADVNIVSDDGSGGTATYFKADGSTGESILYHYGTQKLATSSSGVTVTGNIAVTGTVDGRDVATDGTKLDGIATGANVGIATTGGTFTGDVTFDGDAANIVFDKSHDALVFYQAADLKFTDSAGNQKSRIYSDGTKTTWQSISSVDLDGDFRLVGASYNVEWDKSANALEFADNAKATFGTGSDLQISHGGVFSNIIDSSNALYLQSAAVRFANAGATEIFATMDSTDGVQLKFGGTTKVQTTSSGVTITGGTTSGDFTFAGASYNAVWDSSDNALEFAENARLRFGNSNDFQLFSNGTIGIIGITNTETVQLQNLSNSSVMAKFNPDGSNELYHNNVKKFETSSTGVTVTGTLAATAVTGDGSGLTNVSASDSTKMPLNGGTFTGNEVKFNDNVPLRIGSGSDFSITHNGTNTLFTGDAVFENDLDIKQGGMLAFTTSASVNRSNIKFDGTRTTWTNTSDYPIRIDGSFEVISGLSSIASFETTGVDLYYSNSKKFETTSSGATVTGTLTTSALATGDLAATGSMTIDVGNNLTIDADGGNIFWKDGGTEFYRISKSLNGGVNLYAPVQDQDITLQGNDGGSIISALFLDMSDAGTAHFNNHIYTDGKIGLDADDYIKFTNASQMDVYIANNNRFRFEADGDFHADGNVIAYSSTISDERLKEDIKPITGALDKVGQLNGYTFTYKADGKQSAGVIAQEIEAVLPSAVTETTLPLKADDDVEYKTVQYDQLHGLLIEAIKELKAEIEELKNGSTK